MTIEYIVVHCSASAANQDLNANDIRKYHTTKRGWKDIGYHYVIKRNGELELGRKLGTMGAHVYGYNKRSLGVCLIGGKHSITNRGENNFNKAQFVTLNSLLETLKIPYPAVKITGHRDLSPDANGDGHVTRDEWLKECPCFDVKLLESYLT